MKNPGDRTDILEALDTLEAAIQNLDEAAGNRWPRYTAERFRKIRRSFEILASDLRSDWGGWA